MGAGKLQLDHWFLKYVTISKFYRAGFFFDIRPSFCVICDFEVGTNVSCEDSTVSPPTGLIFSFLIFRVQVAYMMKQDDNDVAMVVLYSVLVVGSLLRHTEQYAYSTAVEDVVVHISKI